MMHSLSSAEMGNGAFRRLRGSDSFYETISFASPPSQLKDGVSKVGTYVQGSTSNCTPRGVQNF